MHTIGQLDGVCCKVRRSQNNVRSGTYFCLFRGEKSFAPDVTRDIEVLPTIDKPDTLIPREIRPKSPNKITKSNRKIYLFPYHRKKFPVSEGVLFAWVKSTNSVSPSCRGRYCPARPCSMKPKESHDDKSVISRSPQIWRNPGYSQRHLGRLGVGHGGDSFRLIGKVEGVGHCPTKG